jgi:succinoglycan biosynthesis protein ExoO
MADVSVIIPVYNNAATIGRAIASAQGQTLRDIEIVVVDDASTDQTFDVLTKLAAADPRIKVVRLPKNLGAGGARNAALANATGDWIAVLDADDWFLPNRLEMLLKAAKMSNAIAVLDNLQIYDHARNDIFEITRHGLKDGVMPVSAETYFLNDDPVRRHVLGILKPMVRRDFITEHKVAYDPSHRTGEDFIFLAEIILQGGKTVLVPDAYYVYVRRASPTSHKVSPHSRSGFNYELIIRGCDELMRKYGSTMTPGARRALERRRYLFRTRMTLQHMLVEFSDRHLSKAALIMLKQPMILVFLVSAVIRRVQTNVMSSQRSLGKLLMIPRR